MQRLHSVESPTVWHRETKRYNPRELDQLARKGILATLPTPEEGPSPRGDRGRPWVGFRRIGGDLHAVALEEDDFFEPFRVTEDEVRCYEVRVSRLMEHIRRDNAITGDTSPLDSGLIPVGHKQVEGFGAVEVCLSLPNADRDAFRARCLALQRPSGIKRLAVLLPMPVTLPAAEREQLDGRGITLIPLFPSTEQGHLRIDWTSVIVSSASGARPDGVVPPRTIVFRGLEYSCELTKREMTFLDIALRGEEVDIGAVYSRKGPVWKGTFANTKETRGKIAKFLSRLNEKLASATPPFPVAFSLARGRQAIVRV